MIGMARYLLGIWIQLMTPIFFFLLCGVAGTYCFYIESVGDLYI